MIIDCFSDSGPVFSAFGGFDEASESVRTSSYRDERPAGTSQNDKVLYVLRNVSYLNKHILFNHRRDLEQLLKKIRIKNKFAIILVM